MAVTKHTATLLLGLAIAVGGVIYLSVSLYRSFTPAPPMPIPTLVDQSATATLESAEQFLTPQTDQDRADLPGRIVDAMRSASPDPRDAALLRQFRERLAIAVNPDYDRYIAHIASVTGSSAAEVRSQLGENHQRRWEITAQTLRDASFGLDGCEIRPGDRILNRSGGGVAFRTDPGVYGSARLLAPEHAELREVRVPVIFSVSMGGVGRTLLVYFVTGFVWDSARSAWIPFISGFHDPSDQEEHMPAPWL